MNWGDNILKIASLYREELWNCEDAEVYLKTFCNTCIKVEILCLAYQTLTHRKQIDEIEKLEESEKRKLWEEAKRLTDTNDRKYLIRVSKAIYTLGQYVQLPD